MFFFSKSKLWNNDGALRKWLFDVFTNSLTIFSQMRMKTMTIKDSTMTHCCTRDKIWSRLLTFFGSNRVLLNILWLVHGMPLGSSWKKNRPKHRQNEALYILLWPVWSNLREPYQLVFLHTVFISTFASLVTYSICWSWYVPCYLDEMRTLELSDGCLDSYLKYVNW